MSADVIHPRFRPDSEPLDAIDTLCVGEPDTVRTLRRRIHRCSGYSASRAVKSQCGDARSLFWQASQLAGAWTFRPASESSLRDALGALHHLYAAADTLERLETPAEGPEAS